MDTDNWKLVQEGFVGKIYKRVTKTKKRLFSKKEKTVSTWELFFSGPFYDASTLFLNLTGLNSKIVVEPER